MRFPKKEEIFTIPNAMTAVGGALTWDGANTLEEPSGFAKVVVGRSLDALDGTVARKTGQTSDFGALLDAGIDKVATAKLVGEMWRRNAAPKGVLSTIALFHAINAGATFFANIRRTTAPTRPTKSGKLAMAAETVSLFAYTGAHTAERAGKPELAKYLRALGGGAFLTSLPGAIHSTATYTKRAWQNPDQK